MADFDDDVFMGPVTQKELIITWKNRKQQKLETLGEENCDNSTPDTNTRKHEALPGEGNRVKLNEILDENEGSTPCTNNPSEHSPMNCLNAEGVNKENDIKILSSPRKSVALENNEAPKVGIEVSIPDANVKTPAIKTLSEHEGHVENEDSISLSKNDSFVTTRNSFDDCDTPKSEISAKAIDPNVNSKGSIEKDSDVVETEMGSQDRVSVGTNDSYVTLNRVSLCENEKQQKSNKEEQTNESKDVEIPKIVVETSEIETRQVSELKQNEKTIQTIINVPEREKLESDSEIVKDGSDVRESANKGDTEMVEVTEGTNSSLVSGNTAASVQNNVTDGVTPTEKIEQYMQNMDSHENSDTKQQLANEESHKDIVHSVENQKTTTESCEFGDKEDTEMVEITEGTNDSLISGNKTESLLNNVNDETTVTEQIQQPMQNSKSNLDTKKEIGKQEEIDESHKENLVQCVENQETTTDPCDVTNREDTEMVEITDGTNADLNSGNTTESVLNNINDETTVTEQNLESQENSGTKQEVGKQEEIYESHKENLVHCVENEETTNDPCDVTNREDIEMVEITDGTNANLDSANTTDSVQNIVSDETTVTEKIEQPIENMDSQDSSDTKHELAKEENLKENLAYSVESQETITEPCDVAEKEDSIILTEKTEQPMQNMDSHDDSDIKREVTKEETINESHKENLVHCVENQETTTDPCDVTNRGDTEMVEITDRTNANLVSANAIDSVQNIVSDETTVTEKIEQPIENMDSQDSSDIKQVAKQEAINESHKENLVHCVENQETTTDPCDATNREDTEMFEITEGTNANLDSGNTTASVQNIVNDETTVTEQIEQPIGNVNSQDISDTKHELAKEENVKANLAYSVESQETITEPCDVDEKEDSIILTEETEHPMQNMDSHDDSEIKREVTKEETINESHKENVVHCVENQETTTDPCDVTNREDTEMVEITNGTNDNLVSVNATDSMQNNDMVDVTSTEKIEQFVHNMDSHENSDKKQELAKEDTLSESHKENLVHSVENKKTTTEPFDFGNKDDAELVEKSEETNASLVSGNTSVSVSNNVKDETTLTEQIEHSIGNIDSLEGSDTKQELAKEEILIESQETIAEKEDSTLTEKMPGTSTATCVFSEKHGEDVNQIDVVNSDVKVIGREQLGSLEENCDLKDNTMQTVTEIHKNHNMETELVNEKSNAKVIDVQDTSKANEEVDLKSTKKTEMELIKEKVEPKDVKLSDVPERTEIVLVKERDTPNMAIEFVKEKVMNTQERPIEESVKEEPICVKHCNDGQKEIVDNKRDIAESTLSTFNSSNNSLQTIADIHDSSITQTPLIQETDLKQSEPVSEGQHISKVHQNILQDNSVQPSVDDLVIPATQQQTDSTNTVLEQTDTKILSPEKTKIKPNGNVLEMQNSNLLSDVEAMEQDKKYKGNSENVPFESTTSDKLNNSSRSNVDMVKLGGSQGSENQNLSSHGKNHSTALNVSENSVAVEKCHMGDVQIPQSNQTPHDLNSAISSGISICASENPEDSKISLSVGGLKENEKNLDSNKLELSNEIVRTCNESNDSCAPKINTAEPIDAGKPATLQNSSNSGIALNKRSLEDCDNSKSEILHELVEEEPKTKKSKRSSDCSDTCSTIQEDDSQTSFNLREAERDELSQQGTNVSISNDTLIDTSNVLSTENVSKLDDNDHCSQDTNYSMIVNIDSSETTLGVSSMTEMDESISVETEKDTSVLPQLELSKVESVVSSGDNVIGSVVESNAVESDSDNKEMVMPENASKNVLESVENKGKTGPPRSSMKRILEDENLNVGTQVVASADLIETIQLPEAKKHKRESQDIDSTVSNVPSEVGSLCSNAVKVSDPEFVTDDTIKTGIPDLIPRKTDSAAITDTSDNANVTGVVTEIVNDAESSMNTLEVFEPQSVANNSNVTNSNQDNVNENKKVIEPVNEENTQKVNSLEGTIKPPRMSLKRNLEDDENSVAELDVIPSADPMTNVQLPQAKKHKREFLDIDSTALNDPSDTEMVLSNTITNGDSSSTADNEVKTEIQNICSNEPKAMENNDCKKVINSVDCQSSINKNEAVQQENVSKLGGENIQEAENSENGNRSSHVTNPLVSSGNGECGIDSSKETDVAMKNCDVINNSPGLNQDISQPGVLENKETNASVDNHIDEADKDLKQNEINPRRSSSKRALEDSENLNESVELTPNFEVPQPKKHKSDSQANVDSTVHDTSNVEMGCASSGSQTDAITSKNNTQSSDTSVVASSSSEVTVENSTISSNNSDKEVETEDERGEKEHFELASSDMLKTDKDEDSKPVQSNDQEFQQPDNPPSIVNKENSDGSTSSQVSSDGNNTTENSHTTNVESEDVPTVSKRNILMPAKLNANNASSDPNWAKRINMAKVYKPTRPDYVEPVKLD